MKLLCLFAGHDGISVGYGVNCPGPNGSQGYNLLECRRCGRVWKSELGFLAKFLLPTKKSETLS
jgi:hypothetical protein